VAAAIYLALRLSGYFRGGKCRATTSLAGQVAVITGANTGIGLETAMDFIRRGVSTLIIGCRDMKKAELAVQKMRTVANSTQRIELFHLDLANLETVDQFAQSIKSKVDKVHLLVNNAGLFGGNGGPTKDGFELHFGVNYLGHFKLTVLLEPELIRAAETSSGFDGPGVRVVNVSSNGYAFTRPNGLDIDHPRFGYHSGWKYDGYFSHHRHYGQSKLSQIYHAYSLTQKFAKKGLPITAYSLHPGLVKTEITRHHLEIGLGHIFNTTIEIMFSLFGKTCVEGAQTTLYCSLDKEAEAGEYFMDCTRHALQGGLEKEKTEGSKPEKLWVTSLQMLGMKSTL